MIADQPRIEMPSAAFTETRWVGDISSDYLCDGRGPLSNPVASLPTD
jgi:hypothetical protein